MDGKLILVSAPAGSGKTTLVSDWARECKEAVAWLSLDKGDNDPTRFLAYLVAALQIIDGELGRGVLAMFQTPKPPPLETALTGLLNQISDFQDQLVLVLDDYHLIEAEAIHRVIAFTLEHQPRNLHLVLIARSDPQLNLARLRARAQLTEMRLSDLRFTAEEAADFLKQVMGLTLSVEEVNALARRTEGWVAGLQMAAVSLEGRDAPDVTAFIDAFTGSNRYVMDYLIEEVLRRQPESGQTFLLETSILDRLTGQLCDAVTGRDDGESTLEQMDRANLFLVRLDDEGRWYRYHRLFAELLRRRLDQRFPERVTELHQRASQWFEEQGQLPAAIDQAIAAKEWPQAAELIEAAAEPTLMRSEVRTFLGWVEALPDEQIQSRPRLSALRGGALLLSGSPLEVVERHLGEAEEADNAGRAAAEAAVFRATIAMLQGDVASSTAFSQQALATLPEESLFLRGLASDNLGLLYALIGDFDSAIEALEETVSLGKKSGNIMGSVAALSNVAGLNLSQGRLKRAESLYRRSLELAVDEGGKLLPVAGKALLGLGELAREWNEMEAATEYLTEGIRLTRQYTEIGSIIGYVSLAYIRQLEGNVAAADRLLEKAREIAVKYDVSEMDDRLVDTMKARLWVMQGQLDRQRLVEALNWIEEEGLALDEPEGSNPLQYDMYELMQLTLARALIIQDEPEQALAKLQPLLPTAERRKRMRRVLEILILQALAYQTLKDEQKALEVIERALTQAEPEGYVQAFVGERQPMASLLYKAAGQGIRPNYCGRLLAAFPSGEPSGVDGAGQELAEMVEPLSERELQVLQLIAEGLSNREIAGRLVISLSTVKGHTANIYGKLGVNSRTQAVAKAQGLGILPNP